MDKIMSATLEPTGTVDKNGECTEYQWFESTEVEGTVGWDTAEGFVESCLPDVEIIENPKFAIHNLPQGAVVVTSAECEEGHNIAFEIYWAE